MATITDMASLKMQIAYLEQKREVEKHEIKAEISSFVESLKPANLLRHFIHSVRGSSELKDDLIHGAVGLGTGFLTNKLLLSSFHGPLKKVIAMVVQAGITNAAVKYPEEIKTKAIGFITKILQGIKFKESDSVVEKDFSNSSL